MRRLAPLLLLTTAAACADGTAPRADGPGGPLPSTARPAPDAARAPAAAAAGVVAVYNTRLLPENEVAAAPARSTASGHAQIRLTAGGELEYRLTVHNPGRETFFIGHIHRGPAGTNGLVVVDLLGRVSESGRQLHLRGTRPLAPALAAELRANPAGFYVNLHTTQAPAGAIRGQLR